MKPWIVRIGWMALVAIPISLGFGRFWQIYLAPAVGIPYAYRTVVVSVSDVLVALTCLGWLAWRVASSSSIDRPRGTRLVASALALLVLAAAISVATAYQRQLAVGVALQLALLLVFFMAVTDRLSAWPKTAVINGIAIAVLVQSLLAVWQAVAQTTAPAGRFFNGWGSELTGHDPGAAVVIVPLIGRWLRAYGSFPHPNILGGFLAITLGVLAVQRDARSQRLRLAALAIGFIALLLSFSRSAWLAEFLAALTIVLVMPEGRGLWRGDRNRLVVAAAGAAFIVVALVRITSLGSLVEQNSIQTRAFYGSVATAVIAHGTPVGAGNLVVAQQHLLGVAAAGSEPAHNVFVIGFAELGPLGLAAWLGLIASLLAAAWLRRDHPSQALGPLLAFALLAPLLLLDHYLWTLPAGRIMLVWAVAILMNSGSGRQRQRAHQPSMQSAAVPVLERWTG